MSLLLVGLYGWSVVQSGRRASSCRGCSSGVYTYLYVVVQMEDFALLAGTGALFTRAGGDDVCHAPRRRG